MQVNANFPSEYGRPLLIPSTLCLLLQSLRIRSFACMEAFLLNSLICPILWISIVQPISLRKACSVICSGLILRMCVVGRKTVSVASAISLDLMFLGNFWRTTTSISYVVPIRYKLSYSDCLRRIRILREASTCYYFLSSQLLRTILELGSSAPCKPRADMFFSRNQTRARKRQTVLEQKTT